MDEIRKQDEEGAHDCTSASVQSSEDRGGEGLGDSLLLRAL